MKDSQMMLAVIFSLSFLAAIITSLSVTSKKLWISMIFCLTAGFSVGIYMGGLQAGLVPGSIFSCIFVVGIIPGARITRYLKIRAIKKLKDDKFKS